MFPWTKASSDHDRPEDDSLTGLALLLRLLLAATVVLFVVAVPTFALTTIALIGVQISDISYWIVVAMVLIAVWTIAFFVLEFIASYHRPRSRRKGFDVLPPKSK